MIMRKNVFLLIIVVVMGYSSCSNEMGEGMDALNTSEIPGSISEMAIDNNNVFYFVSTEIDKEKLADWPPYSSSLPCRSYLSRKANETASFEIVDDRYEGGDKLCFDKNNQLWSYSSQTVYKRDGKSSQKIIELPYDGGLFEFMAVDNDNNVWVGGLQTGLYQIDSHLKVTHYTFDNSKLPTNSMTNIHIDKNNNIWIALCNRGVLKIANDQWVVYENISSQNIWCLTTDKNGHLWIGTGHFNEEYQSLRRFDSTQWETINPRNDKNEHVTGTVRYLQAGGQKIYAVAEHVHVFPSGGGAQQYANELLTFDGNKWDKIYEIPDEVNIFNLVADHYRQALWVTTQKGIYKIPF